jgi:glucan endo-1,3-beta-D-glucosidase
VFVYDVRAEFAGKACTLALYMPPPFTMPEMAPVHIRSPGGVSVLRLASQVSNSVAMRSIGTTSHIGTVPLVEMASQYNVASFPCETGQRVGYQVDSVGGFEADWFQMTYPALGLFLLVR